ncbi:MAG: hypothetical protein SEPTF4163_004842, partial [Sporothrix epigloea]
SCIDTGLADDETADNTSLYNLAWLGELPALNGAEESAFEQSCIDTGLADDETADNTSLYNLALLCELPALDGAEDHSATDYIAPVNSDDSASWPDELPTLYGAEESVSEAPVSTSSCLDAELTDGDSVTSHGQSVSSVREIDDSRETAIYKKLVTMPESGKIYPCGLLGCSVLEWSVAAPVPDVLSQEIAGQMERVVGKDFYFLEDHFGEKKVVNIGRTSQEGVG